VWDKKIAYAFAVESEEWIERWFSLPFFFFFNIFCYRIDFSFPLEFAFCTAEFDEESSLCRDYEYSILFERIFAHT
jgi:hypothetical protein